VSGHELKDEQIGVVRRPTPEQAAQLALRLARQAVAAGHSREAIVDVLEHLGLRAPVEPTGGRTTPIGGNVSPEVQRRRREANAARKRAARERKAKETP